MSLEKSIFVFAGFMVLLSLALTHWVSSHFIWLTAFVGVNLIQSAFTGFCPAAMVMRYCGIKSEAEITTAKLAKG
ncbi:MAG: YgaP family membrane protein [Shewanella sp.]